MQGYVAGVGDFELIADDLAGIGVAVGICVAVGNGVGVGTNVADAVGVCAAGAMAEQADNSDDSNGAVYLFQPQ